MKTFLLFTSLFFVGSLKSQERLTASLDTFRFIQNRLYAHYSVKPFTGLLTEYYPNKGKKFEVPYIDGIPTGIYKEWFGNGILKLEGNYNERGREEGLYKQYYEDGSVDIVGYYKDGVADSVWCGYYRNGKLAKYSFYKNGMKEGEWKYWTPKGELYGIELYEKDVMIQDKQLIDYFPVEAPR